MQTCALPGSGENVTVWIPRIITNIHVTATSCIPYLLMPQMMSSFSLLIYKHYTFLLHDWQTVAAYPGLLHQNVVHFVLLVYNNELTPWNWALLEKPPVAQLLKNFPTSYETRGFITVYTRALHRSISSASSIQPILRHHISLSSILILYRVGGTCWE
jgi:hypothetical protein